MKLSEIKNIVQLRNRYQQAIVDLVACGQIGPDAFVEMATEAGMSDEEIATVVCERIEAQERAEAQ